MPYYLYILGEELYMIQGCVLRITLGTVQWTKWDAENRTRISLVEGKFPTRYTIAQTILLLHCNLLFKSLENFIFI